MLCNIDEHKMMGQDLICDKINRHSKMAEPFVKNGFCYSCSFFAGQRHKFNLFLKASVIHKINFLTLSDVLRRPKMSAWTHWFVSVGCGSDNNKRRAEDVHLGSIFGKDGKI
jgi:hypothetical protein